MTSLTTALVAWDEFLRLPDAREGERYELHDGEVVVVPPPRWLHKKMQNRVAELLRKFGNGEVMTACPYRPAVNLQFWYADVAFIPISDWVGRLAGDDYAVYSPALLVEVLSPSNCESKVGRQRVNAMSNGTQEFWVVSIEQRTVQVTTENSVTLYREGDLIASGVLGATIPVSALFEGRFE